MMIENLLLRCATIVESFGKLPGAPTPQWCDRAATSLAPLAPSGLVSVAIVHHDSSHVIRETANLGVWSPSPERTTLAMRRLCRSGTQIPDVGRVSAQPLSQFTPLRELATGDFLTGSVWSASHPVSEHGDTSLVVHLLQPASSGTSHATSVGGEQPEAALAHAAIRTLATFAGEALPARDGSIRWLTRRESEVLEQLTLGYSIREIAELLHLSHHTVQDHVKHLHSKLDASNRGELVARALGRRAK
jgi:DNA-binding CsgD family transcriptional regulator